ncbi:MAG: hypothetical protein PHS72_02790 [Lachnospiraceae bacterium]|nr:hypothetical protein [Lachnospiraceae bacterium]
MGQTIEFAGKENKSGKTLLNLFTREMGQTVEFAGKEARPTTAADVSIPVTSNDE